MSVSSLPRLVGVILLLCCAGCGDSAVTGGTRGVITTGGAPLGEVQVTVFVRENDTWKLLGFAVTTDDGSFELVTPGAQGPLKLTPGDYRCTLESAGAPLFIPPEYMRPDTTPLRFTWSPEAPRIQLETPPLAVLR